MPKNFQNMLIVSISTLGSRILGLLRDIVMFAAFGASGLTSAFIFAFTLPNLFRRLLGEGALTSALVPVLSSEIETQGRDAAFVFVNQVLTRVACVLFAIVLCGVIVLLGAMPALDWLFLKLGGEGTSLFGGWFTIPEIPERFRLGGELGALMMPYLFFICLAAVYAAVLNVLHRFTIASLTGVWLNLSMIGALAIASYCVGMSQQQGIYFLASAVLLGGLLQFGIPLLALRREGWRYRVDFRPSNALSVLYALLIPGVIGASIVQINLVVSRMLAFQLDSTAVSVLYLASRLIELPLGIFAIAVTTVVFPHLSRLIAANQHTEAGEVYAEGLRLILGITLPAAVGLALLGEPILEFLFGWGAFDSRDINLTLPVLFVFAWALPLYAFAGYGARAFHSLKDTRTPVKIAGLAFVTNTVLSVVLMIPWGATGLALASAISSLLQVVLLHQNLQRKDACMRGHGLRKAVGQVFVASFAMGVSAVLGWIGIQEFIIDKKWAASVAVGGLIPVCVLIYAGVLWGLDFKELRLISAYLRKRKSRLA